MLIRNDSNEQEMSSFMGFLLMLSGRSHFAQHQKCFKKWVFFLSFESNMNCSLDSFSCLNQMEVLLLTYLMSLFVFGKSFKHFLYSIEQLYEIAISKVYSDG